MKEVTAKIVSRYSHSAQLDAAFYAYQEQNLQGRQSQDYLHTAEKRGPAQIYWS